MKLEFRKLFFWLLTWGFWVPLEEPENFINWYLWFYHSVLHDFEMQVLGMVTVIYAEWLTCRYAIFNMECRLTSSHLQFCFLQTLFLVQEQVIKKNFLLACLHDSGKRNVYIGDPWSSTDFLHSWTVPDTQLYDPRNWNFDHGSESPDLLSILFCALSCGL